MSFSRYLKRTEQLLLRWGEEPIGVGVPFVAFLAVWLPPQMPDMFAGMETPIWQLTISARPFLFAFAATLLGLSAWFWTRAALTARHDHPETDSARLRRKKILRASDYPDGDEPRLHRSRHDDDAIAWSEEWAPRMALLFAGAITVLPILFAVRTGHFFTGLLGAELMSFGLVGLLFAFVVYRTEFRWMRAFDAPAWMARWRATRIIANAPFGWPFAVLSLSCSLVALIFVGVAPGFIAQFDAPTTALASLAFAVGPLVIALAIVRGLVERLIYLVRWLVNGGHPFHLAPGEAPRVKRLSNILGTVVLGLWFLSPPWVLDKHVVRLTTTPISEPAGQQACASTALAQGGVRGICRPDLRAALQEWVAARRRVSGRPSGRIPVIIVAAEGGASRAAVWMLAAMRMLDNKTNGDFGRHVFAVSGVSGGSLGAATYAHMLRARGREDGALDWDDKDTRQALARFATKDLLSATISTYFLNDMFGSMIGPLWTWAGIPDRNVALEHTFESLWDDNKGFAVPRHVPSGFLALRFSPQSDSQMPVELLPHLLLNGTDVGSGKRMITSTIRWSQAEALFPDSGDLIQLVSHDVRMATAVTNSARFPFISPAGRFVSTNADGATAYQIIDGGYFENYGARTVWELARAIEDLNAQDPSLEVVPVVVVISNDLDADQAPRAKGGACRTMLEDTHANGTQVTIRCDEPKAAERCVATQIAGMAGELKPQDQTIVPQSLAPIFGLAATRTAHGRDALNILRRDFCRAQTGEEGDPKVRMIHIALPKPDTSKGEAAPMNWVLNPQSCDYMLNKAPWLAFNLRQAETLAATLDAVNGQALRTSQADAPAPIDCYAR
ncbi:MAG: patatin-like phospholipase family protein [Alphaproteobacteria bacterium]|nr:patatin-like phospholipase family protein [Alphaproteobacteria bacterium]